MEQQNEHIRHFMNVLWTDLQEELNKVFERHIEQLKELPINTESKEEK